jgi:hypothetical protein
MYSLGYKALYMSEPSTSPGMFLAGWEPIIKNAYSKDKRHAALIAMEVNER